MENNRIIETTYVVIYLSNIYKWIQPKKILEVISPNLVINFFFLKY